MVWKVGKTLKNFLYAGAFATAASILPGCEKPDDPIINPPEDTTSPKIIISSPVENRVYTIDTILYSGTIIENNPNMMWYSTDNEKTKISLEGKSWDKKLILPEGSNRIITYADDKSGNYTKKDIYFSIKKPVNPAKIIVNEFAQPNRIDKNWYGSGDVNNDNSLNSQDLERLVNVINGNYTDPNDKRLYDRADVNGDRKVDQSDLEMLTKKLNGVIVGMSGEWGLLLLPQQRKDWFERMLKIDNTNERPATINFGCEQRSYQMMMNFGNLTEEEIQILLNNNPEYLTTDINRFRIPLKWVAIRFYDSNNVPIGSGHSTNTVIFEDNLNWEGRCNFDAGNDQMYVNFLKDYRENTDHVRIWIMTPPLIASGEFVGLHHYLTYDQNKEGVATLVYTDPDVEVVTERKK